MFSLIFVSFARRTVITETAAFDAFGTYKSDVVLEFHRTTHRFMYDLDSFDFDRNARRQIHKQHRSSLTHTFNKHPTC